MLRIIIVDDHQLFRKGLQSLLEENQDYHVLPGLQSGEELIAALRNGLDPHIVLLDLTMPGMDGFEVLKIAKKEFPDIRFIAISMHDDGHYITKCARLGAYGYLLKNAEVNELQKAINKVAQGKKYYNEEITDLMINNMSLQATQVKPLSQRETEVLRLVSEGKTTKEIANTLFVSTRTVETHRSNIMKKMDVQNTAELIRKALELKLLD